MSCFALGLRVNSVSLGAALSIGRRCESLGPEHEGASPPNMWTQCPHTHVHSHRHAYTHLSILATEQGMPAHQLACVPACWGREARVCWRKQGQSMCALMSFMFFYVISQHVFAGLWCLRGARPLSDRGKISCCFQMALCKRLLWCTKSDLKCACSCLWFFFPSKPRWQGMPFRVLPLHI